MTNEKGSFYDRPSMGVITHRHKARVIGCEWKWSWYANQIGEEFEIGHTYHSGNQNWEVLSGVHRGSYIDDVDLAHDGIRDYEKQPVPCGYWMGE